MLLVATIASLTCVTLATPLYIGSTPGGSAICSAAESAYYGAKGEGKSNHLAGAIAGKVFYNKVFNVFDGSINCGSSIDAVNGVADYFNKFGKSVITTICKKATTSYLDARISGASKEDALKAAGTTYTDFIEDFPDPDNACYKTTQDPDSLI